jgi:transposase
MEQGRMLLKSILNRVQGFKSFVYGRARWAGTQSKPAIEVELRARANSRPICSKCQRPGPGYDTLEERRFEFIPLWGIKIFFLYSPRRVGCKRCGVNVEAMPWANGKRPITDAYAWYLAGWAKRLSWKGVAQAFETTWDTVYASVKMAVDWGLANRSLDGISAIGIDEIQWQRGHKYLTLVYQIDAHCRRLLWIGEERKAKTLLRFFRWFGAERTAGLQFVCSDMWKAYMKVVKKKCSAALHILDRYHVMSNMNKAIDKVRAGDVKKLKAEGREPVLKKSRWIFLKRPENLTEKQDTKLSELLSYNLRTVRSYLLKEEFQDFWTYQSAYWAGRFLDRWCTKVMRSKIEPMKEIARSLRNHRPLLLNWFRARGAISNAVVEGFNNKAKLTTRKAYGFRTFEGEETALYHALGDLPTPKFAHRFF